MKKIGKTIANAIPGKKKLEKENTQKVRPDKPLAQQEITGSDSFSSPNPSFTHGSKQAQAQAAVPPSPAPQNTLWKASNLPATGEINTPDQSESTHAALDSEQVTDPGQRAFLELDDDETFIDQSASRPINPYILSSLPPQHATSKRTIDFEFSDFLMHAEDLRLLNYDPGTDRRQYINFNYNSLPEHFGNRTPETKRAIMKELSMYKIGVAVKHNNPSLLQNIKDISQYTFPAGLRTPDPVIRGDVAFMLRLGKHKNEGSFFGDAIVSAVPVAVHSMLELLKHERYFSKMSMVSAVTTVARRVTDSYHENNVSAIESASSLIQYYLETINPEDEDNAARALLYLLNKCTINTAVGDSIRGCLAGIVVAGAIRFSEKIKTKDEARLQRWHTFNEALWGGLASIAFPGVAAVTKVLEITARKILTSAVTIRDFKAAMYKTLAEIKHQAIHSASEEAGFDTENAVKKSLESGLIIDWMGVALNANGLP